MTADDTYRLIKKTMKMSGIPDNKYQIVYSTYCIALHINNMETSSMEIVEGHGYHRANEYGFTCYYDLVRRLFWSAITIKGIRRYPSDYDSSMDIEVDFVCCANSLPATKKEYWILLQQIISKIIRDFDIEQYEYQ